METSEPERKNVIIVSPKIPERPMSDLLAMGYESEHFTSFAQLLTSDWEEGRNIFIFNSVGLDSEEGNFFYSMVKEVIEKDSDAPILILAIGETKIDALKRLQGNEWKTAKNPRQILSGCYSHEFFLKGFYHITGKSKQ